MMLAIFMLANQAESLLCFLPAELHRHLEGSPRLDTMAEIAEQHGIHFSNRTSFVRWSPSWNRSLHLQELPPNLTPCAVSPLAGSHRLGGLCIAVAMRPPTTCAVSVLPLCLGVAWGHPAGGDGSDRKIAQASREHHIQTRLIASMNRHEDLKIAEQVIQFAVDRKDRGVVGIDLAGN
jgi:hypothetical protein